MNYCYDYVDIFTAFYIIPWRMHFLLDFLLFGVCGAARRARAFKVIYGWIWRELLIKSADDFALDFWCRRGATGWPDWAFRPHPSGADFYSLRMPDNNWEQKIGDPAMEQMTSRPPSRIPMLTRTISNNWIPVGNKQRTELNQNRQNCGDVLRINLIEMELHFH